jgi:hypothetical protein
MSDTSSTICQRLMEADAAYHSLIMGSGVRSVVDENGGSVSYSVADSGRLLAYIARLAPLCPGYTPTAPVVTSPLRFIF